MHDVEYLNLLALNLDASSNSSDSIDPYRDKILPTSLLIAVIQAILDLQSSFSIAQFWRHSRKIWVKDHGCGSFSEILSKFYQVNAVSEQALK